MSLHMVLGVRLCYFGSCMNMMLILCLWLQRRCSEDGCVWAVRGGPETRGKQFLVLHIYLFVFWEGEAEGRPPCVGGVL